MGDLTCFSNVRNACYDECENVCLWARVCSWKCIVYIYGWVSWRVSCVGAAHVEGPGCSPPTFWVLKLEARCRVWKCCTHRELNHSG